MGEGAVSLLRKHQGLKWGGMHKQRWVSRVSGGDGLNGGGMYTQRVPGCRWDSS